jgi:type II secretory pathway component GspD/PulD (secretin)
MVLSGFNQQISTSTGSKTPILGDVPLLSLFFSNKSSDTQTNQFIILVTPRPIFPSVATGPAFSEENKQLLQDSGSK